VEEDPLARSQGDRERDLVQATVPRRRPGALWIGMGLGSGMGWHPKKQLEFRFEDAVDAGFSPAGLLQLEPEIGYQLTADYAVSLQSRHQLIPESGSGDNRLGSPAHGATAVLLSVYRYFGTKRGQPFVTAAAGGGEGFRLVVPPHPEMNQVRNDTVRGGPLLLGAGGGYLYNLNGHLGLLAVSRLLVGLPEKAALIEVTGGAQVAF
jgi:hypothetical protein